MITVISLALFAGAMYYAFSPLMGQRVDWLDSEEWMDEERRGLETEKRIFLKALKDIEFERASGKINDDDFNDLRTYYRKKVSDLLDEIQAMGEEEFDDEDEEDGYEGEHRDPDDEDENDFEGEEEYEEDGGYDDEEYEEDDEDYHSTEVPRNRRENTFLGFFWFVLVVMVGLIGMAVVRGV